MRKAVISILVALFAAGLTKCAAARVVVSPSCGLCINGGFIQYQSWMMALPTHQWHLELAAMRRARMNLVVLQFLENDGTSFIPTKPGELDATQCILAYAALHHMKVIIGLSTDDAWWMRWNDPDYLAAEAQRCDALADTVWKRYGHYPSFAGWYIPQEMWDAQYSKTQADQLNRFLHTVSSHCHHISGNKLVSIAPFFSHNATTRQITTNYTTILKNSGVDVLMLQDGVGARNWHDDVAGNVVPTFKAFRRACLKTGTTLWSDMESFQTTARPTDGMVPASVGRIAQQLTAEAPYVSKFVTFDFFHYMSPYRGAAQSALYHAYLHTFVDHAFFPLLGNMVEVDPGFSYYQHRSPNSIAREIRANGYTAVDYVVTTDRHINASLIAAFHAQHIGVWYGTFANGAYSTLGMPREWKSWKVVTRGDLTGHPLNDGFTRFCMNNPGYVRWKQHQITSVLHRYQFQGVMIMEPYWTGHGGILRQSYACFCPTCQRAFEAMYPGRAQLPNIVDPKSPNSPVNNPELWADWLQFRQRTLTRFVNTLVNGKHGVRSECAGKKVCVWLLALKALTGLQQVEEDNGVNPKAITSQVKPDYICLEADWPDWMTPGLPPDYVDGYRPVVNAIRSVAPAMDIIIQADIGSSKDDRHGTKWLDQFRLACRKLGTPDTMPYEYSIGKYMYTDPPRIMGARFVNGKIELSFDRRLKLPDAGMHAHYSVSSGTLTRVSVDGGTVRLTVRNLPRSGTVGITVKKLSDDPSLRLFHDMPAAILAKQTVVVRVH